MVNEYSLNFDGASKGNPGLSGAGFVIYENDKELVYDSKFVSKNATNNVAEYYGLIYGLKEAVKQKIKILIVKGDSNLVIKQMKGEWKVKHPNLIPLHAKAKKEEAKLSKVTYVHIYRDKNKRADELANKALL